MYKLRDEIEPIDINNKNHLLKLCNNKHEEALNILYNNINKLDNDCIYELCFNISLNSNELKEIIFNIIEKYIDKLDDDKLSSFKWNKLCNISNKHIKQFDILIKYSNKISDEELLLCYEIIFRNCLNFNYSNKKLKKFISINAHRIGHKYSYYLCKLEDDYSMNIISNYRHKLDKKHIYNLCRNKHDNAMEIISKKIYMLDESCWYQLCQNTNNKALEIISKYIRYIINLTYGECEEYYHKFFKGCEKCRCWIALSMNPNNKALDILSEYKYKIEWYQLTINFNPKIIDLIKGNKHIIKDYYNLICYHYNRYLDEFADEIIENKNILNELDEYNFQELFRSKNNKLLELISNSERFNEECLLKLCYNSCDKSIEIISNNINKLDSKYLEVLCSFNNNKKIYEIIINNINKLNQKCWINLINNKDPNKINIALMNLDKIKNNDIFTYDYKLMKKNRNKMINIKELNNIRLRKALYYKLIYNYDLILDRYY